MIKLTEAMRKTLANEGRHDTEQGGGRVHKMFTNEGAQNCCQMTLIRL
jgi:hypothetical protein